MSEEKEQKEKKEQKGLKDKLPKKPQLPKNSFNFYWIYALIIVVILGIQFLTFSDDAKPIEFHYFAENMLKKHHVEKIVMVNGKFVEIYIKRDSLKLAQYDAFNKKGVANKANSGPQFTFKIADPQSFTENLNEAYKDFGFSREEKVIPASDERSTWSDQLSWLLPIVLIPIHL